MAHSNLNKSANSLLTSDNVNNLVAVSSDGKFGLGTATPAVFFDVRSTTNFGVNSQGADVKFFGDTSGKAALWDASSDTLYIDRIGEFNVNSGVNIDGLLVKDSALDFGVNSKGNFKGIECYVFRLNATIIGNDTPVGATGGEWTLCDGGAADEECENILGSSPITEANGIFTFTTGYWHINASALFEGADANASEVHLQATNDNSTYNTLASIRCSLPANGNKAMGSSFVMLKVSSTSNDKFRLSHVAGNAASELDGAAAAPYTATRVSFMKLADL